MEAIATCVLLTTRFYITPEGWYTDRPERARVYRDKSDAEIAAAKENAKEASAARWYGTYRMSDGTIVDQ